MPSCNCLITEGLTTITVARVTVSIDTTLEVPSYLQYRYKI